MSDDDDLPNVVALRPHHDPADAQAPVTITRPDRSSPQSYCPHRLTTIDRQARRVYCRDCGVEVPAFDVLLELARRREWVTANRQEAERRRDVARENLRELLRDEANAKARIRSARLRGAPEVARALRELVRVAKRVPGRIGDDELAAAISDAQAALFRHGQDSARERTGT